MKTVGTFEWTSEATTSGHSSTTQAATATIGEPSLNYPGTQEVLVYWNTIFSSFLSVIPKLA